MGSVRWMALLLALVMLRLAQALAALLGMIQLIGLWPGLALLIALLAVNARLLLRMATAYGAYAVWHFPWYAALLFAAPRLLLKLPGVVAQMLARHRHPPPCWSDADVRSVQSLR